MSEVRDIDNYINRKEAIKWFFRPYSNEESYSNADVERALKSLPAADVRENVHGKWEDKKVKSNCEIGQWQSARCNKCGLWHTTPYLYYFDNFNFCPHCGAKMDAEV